MPRANSTRSCCFRQERGDCSCSANAGAKPDVNVVFEGSTRNNTPRSALHVAAARGAEKAAKALTLAGADPNLRDEEGCSPLHVAAEAGHDGVVGLLLLKGARTTVETLDHQQTPLHLAALNALCVGAFGRCGSQEHA